MVESLLEILLREDLHSVANTVGEGISSISKWNIVNQLGKHDLSCGCLVCNLKGRKTFSDQMNGNCLDLILGTHDGNCCTMENLRCLDSVLNERF